MTLAHPMRGSATLLALADQRLPSGGHVHSGGIEQAVSLGVVHDAVTLADFLQRRLRTAGRVAAACAAAAQLVCDLPGGARPVDLLVGLDERIDARLPAPAAREASRAQGRGLLRTARAAWAAPGPQVGWSDLGARPHHPVTLGAAAHAGGTDAEAAALVAAYLTVTGPATAAQRLLGLDPVTVAAVTVSLGREVEDVGAAGAAAARDAVAVVPALGLAAWDALPDDGDPMLDLLAQQHAERGDKLFAS